jgi:histidine triad (HIT) family protein
MAENCTFCKMVAGVIKPSIVYEDEQVIAFRDINPQAPVHVLIVPKKHIATLNDLEIEDAGMAGWMMLAAQNIAAKLSVAESGYRTVINCNRDAGQSVFHIHMHLLGGRHMAWPPG